MTLTQLVPAVNLTNCDQEPIHVPGSVQEHGCLLVFTQSRSGHLIADQASGNAATYLARPLDQILGKTCAELFSEELNAEFRTELEARRNAPPNHFLRSMTLPSGQEMDIITHATGGMLVAEFERTEERVSPSALNATIVNVVAQLELLSDIRELGQAIT